ALPVGDRARGSVPAATIRRALRALLPRDAPPPAAPPVRLARARHLHGRSAPLPPRDARRPVVRLARGPAGDRRGAARAAHRRAALAAAVSHRDPSAEYVFRAGDEHAGATRLAPDPLVAARRVGPVVI